MARDSAATELVWLSPPQPQDLVLTLLADNVRRRREEVWSGGVVTLLDEFGFSAGASRVALARLARRELIAPEKRGRTVSYRLTERAERVLDDGDRRIFSLGTFSYDEGIVTILIHSLPEQMRVERGRLGRQLRFLGFGTTQDGVWIGAGHRDEELLAIVDKLGVGSFSSIVTGCLLGRPDLQSVIDRAWDFPRLSAGYSAFVDAFGKFGDRPPSSDHEAFLVRTQAMHNYRQFPAMDPGIQSARHPAPAIKSAAIETFTRIYSSYEAAAHRYFDSIVDAQTQPR